MHKSGGSTDEPENNVENATAEARERDEDLAKVEIGTLAVILVVTVVGNSMVLVALYAKKRNIVKTAFPRMYFFIFHLCIADLITAFLFVLSQLIWDITYRFVSIFPLGRSVQVHPRYRTVPRGTRYRICSRFRPELKNY